MSNHLLTKFALTYRNINQELKVLKIRKIKIRKSAKISYEQCNCLVQRALLRAGGQGAQLLRPRQEGHRASI